jgi:hypothetical protein
MDALDRERARLNKIRLKKLREKQPAVLRRKAEREKERAHDSQAEGAPRARSSASRFWIVVAVHWKRAANLCRR